MAGWIARAWCRGLGGSLCPKKAATYQPGAERGREVPPWVTRRTAVPHGTRRPGFYAAPDGMKTGWWGFLMDDRGMLRAYRMLRP